MAKQELVKYELEKKEHLVKLELEKNRTGQMGAAKKQQLVKCELGKKKDKKKELVKMEVGKQHNKNWSKFKGSWKKQQPGIIKWELNGNEGKKEGKKN